MKGKERMEKEERRKEERKKERKGRRKKESYDTHDKMYITIHIEPSIPIREHHVAVKRHGVSVICYRHFPLNLICFLSQRGRGI